MRGTILAFDFRTGEGKISGEDGNRYNFAGREWHGQSQPAANQNVDFEASDRDALAIYPVRGAVGPHVEYERNRVAAALLAFFLGVFGIHKFYMNKPGSGIIMLLCSTIGAILVFPLLIMCGISIVEFVIYLTMTDEAFDRTYIQGSKSWF
ncbi:MAG: TM2 domain-containing protein [Sphingomonas sp.]